MTISVTDPKGFKVRLDVAETAQHYSIPPLTLQLLVGNAVKHNETSLAHPLCLT